jgi:hypothetical protein
MEVKIILQWVGKRGDPVSQLPYRFPVVSLNLRIDEQS